MARSNKTKEPQSIIQDEEQQNQSQIKEVLNMYNNLWDQSPIIQKMKAASKAEGEVEALQKTVVNIVKARFPYLADLAQQKAAELSDIEKLNSLIVQLSNATGLTTFIPRKATPPTPGMNRASSTRPLRVMGGISPDGRPLPHPGINQARCMPMNFSSQSSSPPCKGLIHDVRLIPGAAPRDQSGAMHAHELFKPATPRPVGAQFIAPD